MPQTGAVPSALPDGEPVPPSGALPPEALAGVGTRPLGLYLGLGTPLLHGVSRKSYIARLAQDGSAAAERLPGSIAAALAGLAQGVAVLRVHDVAATRQALRIWQALCS